MSEVLLYLGSHEKRQGVPSELGCGWRSPASAAAPSGDMRFDTSDNSSRTGALASAATSAITCGERACVCQRERMRVCERERERMRVCVRERARECVRVREREIEQ